MANYAAAALGSMIGYRSSRADQQRLAILRKAIELMAAMPGVRVSVENLRSLIDERDDALLTAVGGFEDRQYKILSEELLALSLNQRNLLALDAEQLDVEALLGIGQHARPGKTRLSIISTRFLPDAATVDFWVSQLLAAVGRWIGKNPRDQLQAVFLFDEADQYLPAVRQPATKAPMENLLRRARSAGVGLLLATQSPGDFDYKCRENIRAWLVGRIKEDTALNKLKPMLSDFPADIVTKLPSQETGQFYLLREKEVRALRSHPSLMATEQLAEERILELARRAVPMIGRLGP
jgi:DNA helicase HerA-like ATPase